MGAKKKGKMKNKACSSLLAPFAQILKTSKSTKLTKFCSREYASIIHPQMRVKHPDESSIFEPSCKAVTTKKDILSQKGSTERAAPKSHIIIFLRGTNESQPIIHTHTHKNPISNILT
jgi:hypothetical protein